MLIPSKDVKYEKTKYKYTKYFGKEYSTVDIIAYILYELYSVYNVRHTVIIVHCTVCIVPI